MNMKDHTPSLPESLAISPEVRARAAEIITQAKTLNLSQSELMDSLVVSGVALGVESVQAHFLNIAQAQVALLRTVQSQVDAAIMSTSDPDTIRTLDSLRKSVSAPLLERSRILRGMLIDTAKSEMGVDATFLVGNQDVRDYPRAALSSLGFAAYRRSAIYFVSWFSHHQANTLKDQACKCPTCLPLTLRLAQVSESEFMDKALNSGMSMDDLFSAFGEHIVNYYREALQGIDAGFAAGHGAGDASTDPATTETPAAALTRFLGNMRGPLNGKE